jgi:hypothetical protein
LLAAEADDYLSTDPLLLVARVVNADFAASKVSRKAPDIEGIGSQNQE